MTNQDVDTRPYTPTELAAIRTRGIPERVSLIRDAFTARDEERGDFRAALALRSAAAYLRRGATAEAHALLTNAAAAWDEGRNHRTNPTKETP